MPIGFTKYVDITSAVGGNNAVQTTELITRIFSENPLIPTGGAPLEFTTAQAVGNYFGTSSVEYLRAVFYFGWVSKLFTSAQKISYARWANANTAPEIFGTNLVFLGTSLAELQAITNGSFTLKLGATTHNIGSLNFSAATSFADVAADLQTAIRLQSGAQWTSATVTYSNTAGAFNFVGGDTSVAAAVSVSAGTTGTDISQLIGWFPIVGVYPQAPVFSNGVQAETITQTLNNSATQSTNFGSFLFIPSFSTDQVVEAATWNQLQNNLYQYLFPCTASNAATLATALENIGGGGPTLAPLSNEYPEMIPGIILAATNYNSNFPVTQNYMFQGGFNLTPSVTDSTTAAAYDALGINYYGQTQTAGQLQAFYQNGYMTGAATPTNPTDMNVYANEQWFKNAANAAFATLLLGATQVSANAQGVAQVLGTLQEVINQATVNGTISVDGFLSAEQKAAITTLTGDPNAWHQVQTIGYWVGAVVQPVSGYNTSYKIVYTLVYKKNDAIRQIQGLDILI